VVAGLLTKATAPSSSASSWATTSGARTRPKPQRGREMKRPG